MILSTLKNAHRCKRGFSWLISCIRKRGVNMEGKMQTQLSNKGKENIIEKHIFSKMLRETIRVTLAGEVLRNGDLRW